MEEWIKLLVDLFQSIQNSISKIKSKTVIIEADAYLRRLEQVIEAITLCPNNWIVTDIQREDAGIVGGKKIKKIEFKPLDAMVYSNYISIKNIL
ncbi:MAG: hypothetical protein WA941_03355 [Nitrososphaeraceae archaeon]